MLYDVGGRQLLHLDEAQLGIYCALGHYPYIEAP